MSSINFPQIIGHKLTKQHLDNLINTNQLPKSLLLAGPGQIGKTTIISRLAQILQCTNQGCQTCATCQQVAAQTQINTHFFIEPGLFGIDAIRELKVQAHLTSTSKHHLFIIKNIERLNIPASNAFLKLLEEPPAPVRFLLTTSNEIDLLPTIRSRCQTLRLNNLSTTELTTFATKNLPETNITDLQLTLSLGKPGRLQELAQNPEYFAQLQTWYQKLSDLDNTPLSPNHFLLTKEISGLDRSQIIEFLIIYQILVRNQPGSPKLKIIQTTINNINANFNAQLSLENLFLTTTKV